MSVSELTRPPQPEAERRRSWSLDDIPYEQIDRSVVGDDEVLFSLIASASFIEITSETYTRNLVAFCAGDDEVVAWLQEGWQHEEVQHGAALRRYVETAWPDFDWESAYRSFLDEYMRVCSIDLLAPSRASRWSRAASSRPAHRASTACWPRRRPSRCCATRRLHQPRRGRSLQAFLPLLPDLCRARASGPRGGAEDAVKRTGAVDAEDASIAFKHVRLARHPDCPIATRSTPPSAASWCRWRGATTGSSSR